MKSKFKTKSKKTLSKQKKLVVAAVSLVTIATVINSAALTYLFFYRQVHSIPKDNTQIISLINKAIDNLHKPAVIEPVSGKVYLPDARLVLPAHEVELGDFDYRYDPGNNEIPEEVNITSLKDLNFAKLELDRGAYSDIEKAFEAVPNLQACSRGIRIGFKPEPDNKPVATKKLSNNKTAYFYNEELCKNPQMLEYVKQIDSY